MIDFRGFVIYFNFIKFTKTNISLILYVFQLPINRITYFSLQTLRGFPLPFFRRGTNREVSLLHWLLIDL